ncbi:energy-coupling factor transporter ATPase [Streptomyces sp. 8N114]|uniref:energy-coupling factor transporter ATPase n=1 Tax=Streptomyces sp. 8N114 TaxID=3457419 RepID=UPI003FD57ED7
MERTRTHPKPPGDPALPGAEPLVRLHRVRVRHHASEDWTGDGTDLELRTGETVLLLGPSGAGKSSLALTLNGLVPHSVPADLDGTVTVRGMDSRTTTVARLCAEVGMVFQDPDAQVVTRSVLDEVCFGLENILVPAEEIVPRAVAALRTVGLGTDPAGLARDPGTLSGGQRQRLALACALALRPAVLVLDEPTANLDPLGVRDFYRVLARTRTEGTTTLLIEHQLDDAVSAVDRVIVLDARARVRAEGPPGQVFGRHARLLHELGCWRPAAVEIAERTGFPLAEATDPPLTPEDLAESVLAHAAVPEPPRPVGTGDAIRTPDGDGPAAALREVTVRRDGRTVLKEVSLAAAPGDFLAVVGPNGAGKTTVLRTMAGLIRPASGAVLVDGQPVSRKQTVRSPSRMGYVFQNPEHQFVTGSVLAELAHGLQVGGVGEKETADRVADAMKRFGLTAHADRSPFLLSHGEKRRLSVATALITRPALLLMDEPTFAQDQASSRELLELVAQIREAGTTVVAVTHDLQLVADHATQLAVLADGRLLAQGGVRELLSDDALLERAGLRPPPVRRFASILAGRYPSWGRVCGFRDLPANAFERDPT